MSPARLLRSGWLLSFSLLLACGESASDLFMEGSGGAQGGTTSGGQAGSAGKAGGVSGGSGQAGAGGVAGKAGASGQGGSGGASAGTAGAGAGGAAGGQAGATGEAGAGPGGEGGASGGQAGKGGGGKGGGKGGAAGKGGGGAGASGGSPAGGQAGQGGAAEAGASGGGGAAGTAGQPGGGQGGVSGTAGAPGSVCGDGKVEGDEECDDGNGDEFDGCTKKCKLGCLDVEGAKLNKANRHCYWEISGGILDDSWSERRDRCAKEGGHMVTITSAQENEFVSLLHKGEVWIGARDDKQDKNPGPGMYGWVNGEPFVYDAWAEGEPNAAGVSCELFSKCYEHCAVQREDGAWNDRFCGDGNEAICEWEPPVP